MKRIKQFLFYFITSYSLAALVYFILWKIMPHHYVYGVWFRMFLYHYDHPMQYMFIPCFFFAVFALLFERYFKSNRLMKEILWTLFIDVITIIVSSPFGGMLWFYHDMQAGYFPKAWAERLIEHGFTMGLETGWLIILLSFPYNLIGIVFSFFLLHTGLPDRGKHLILPRKKRL